MPEPIVDPNADPQPDPNADPQAAGGEPQAPEMVSIPKEELADIQEKLKKLDVFDSMGFMQPGTQPVAPAAPPGPTMAEQVADIDKEITDIDTEIDSRITDGKGISDLSRKRDGLSSKRIEIRITADHIDPIRQAGFATIDQLSAEVTKGQMPHLNLPTVKASFDQAMGALTPEQKMNPAVRVNAYKLAVGMHFDEIMGVQKEVWLRETASSGTQEPSSTTGRTAGGGGEGDKIPKPEEVLDKGNLDALRTAGKSVDDFYKGMGYTGWDNYWEATGKEYYGMGGEE